MTVLEYNLPEWKNPLRFFGPEINGRDDFFIASSGEAPLFEYLLFFDSRAVGRLYGESLACRLNAFLEGKKFLMICRPLEITTWATLLNFLRLNAIQAEKLITNMGFVDFTPKKAEILEDNMSQIKFLMGRQAAAVSEAGIYASSAEEEITLFVTTYDDDFKGYLKEQIKKFQTILINTPIVSRDINIPRKRPAVFFEMLHETRAFNEQLGARFMVSPPPFDENLTYDAVHYTRAGADLIFSLIKEKL